MLSMLPGISIISLPAHGFARRTRFFFCGEEHQRGMEGIGGTLQTLCIGCLAQRVSSGCEGACRLNEVPCGHPLGPERPDSSSPNEQVASGCRNLGSEQDPRRFSQV